MGGLVFGGLGVGVHLVAATILRRSLDRSVNVLAAGYITGMVLRLAGAIGAFVAVTVAPSLFSPLPTLLGYVAVIIPLLFMEIQFLK